MSVKIEIVYTINRQDFYSAYFTDLISAGSFLKILKDLGFICDAIRCFISHDITSDVESYIAEHEESYTIDYELSYINALFDSIFKISS